MNDLPRALVHGVEAAGDGWSAARPSGAAEVAEVVRLARSRKLPIVIRGAGTKDGQPGPSGPGVILRTTTLATAPDVSPANLTATIGAGAPLVALNRALARHGLFFPPTDLHPDATVGGAIAAGISGPWRLGYGGLRDWVLGLEVVLANGEIVRTGQATMKSVAGYGMTRVFCGSWGTLGVITRAILRLAPIAPAHGTVEAELDSLAQAAAALRPLLRRAPSPMAAEWLSTARSGRGTLLVRLAGEPDAVAVRVKETLRALGSSASERRDGADEGRWDRHREVLLHLATHARVRLRMGVTPGELGAAASLLTEVLGDRVEWRAGQVGTGILRAGLDGPPPVEALARLRERAAALGGYLVVESGPPDLLAATAIPETPAAAALRAALAPDRCFNPHRTA